MGGQLERAIRRTSGRSERDDRLPVLIGTWIDNIDVAGLTVDEIDVQGHERFDFLIQLHVHVRFCGLNAASGRDSSPTGCADNTAVAFLGPDSNAAINRRAKSVEDLRGALLL